MAINRCSYAYAVVFGDEDDFLIHPLDRSTFKSIGIQLNKTCSKVFFNEFSERTDEIESFDPYHHTGFL